MTTHARFKHRPMYLRWILLAMLLAGLVYYSVYAWQQLISASKPVVHASSLANRPPVIKATQPKNQPSKKEGHPLTRILDDPKFLETYKVSPEMAGQFLKKHGRTAGNLLAAFKTTGDSTFLDEAIKIRPNDPNVILAKLATNSLSAEESLEWTDKLKQAEASNSFPYYLSASELMKNGHTEEALAALHQATGKEAFNDHQFSGMDLRQQIYVESGLNEMEAKALTLFGTPLPFATNLVSISKELSNLQMASLAKGDTDTANQLADLGLQVGQRELSGKSGKMLINQLIGITIQSQSVSLLPEDTILSNGMTVGNLRSSLESQRAKLKGYSELAATSLDQIANLDEAETKEYFDRILRDGEKAALDWLKAR